MFVRQLKCKPLPYMVIQQKYCFLMKYKEKKHNIGLQRLKTKILMIQFKFYYQFSPENNCFLYLINLLKSSSYSELGHLENGRKKAF